MSVKDEAVLFNADVKTSCVEIASIIDALQDGHDCLLIDDMIKHINSLHDIAQHLLTLSRYQHSRVFKIGEWVTDGEHECVVLGYSENHAGEYITSKGLKNTAILYHVDRPAVQLQDIFKHVGSSMWDVFDVGERVVMCDTKYAMMSYMLHGMEAFTFNTLVSGVFVGYGSDDYPFVIGSSLDDKSPMHWKYCVREVSE